MTRCPSGPQASVPRTGSTAAASATPPIAATPAQRRIAASDCCSPPTDHASIAQTLMSAEEDRMRGVVFTGDRQLELMNFPDPTPGEGEVVVEMKASGMCGSDLHQYRRPRAGGETGGLAAPSEPTIAGHEPCGVIAAVGPGVSAAQAQIGQRVMVHHYKGCTVCNHCRSGWSQ